MIKELMFISLIGISPLSNDVDSNAKNKKWSNFYKQLAMSDIESNRYGGAISNLEKSLEYEESAESYVLLGESYGNIGDKEKAAAGLEKSLTLNYDVGVATRLGNFYLSNNQYDKSLEKFVKVLELRPDNPASFNNIGFAYSKIGEYENARKFFEEAIAKAVAAGVEYEDFFFNAAINSFDLYKKDKDAQNLFDALYYSFLAEYAGNEAALSNARGIFELLIKKDVKEWSSSEHTKFNILRLRCVSSYLELFNAESRKRIEELRSKFMGVFF